MAELCDCQRPWASSVSCTSRAPGRPDLLIDLQGLPQVRGSFSGVPVKQAAAYSFQRPCLFARGAKLASDGERLSVLALGLLGRRGSQR